MSHVVMALSSSSRFGLLPSSNVPDVFQTNLVVPRVTGGGGGGALARNSDGTRCAVAGRESLRIVRGGSLEDTHQSGLEVSRNFWDGASEADGLLTNIAWGRGQFAHKILTGARSGELVLWDIDRSGGKQERRARDHLRAIHALALCTHYPHYAITGAADGDLRVWDLRDFQRSISRANLPSAVRSAVSSPELGTSLHILFGLDDGSLYRWDLRMGQRGQLDRVPVAHGGPVLCLDWCGPLGASGQSASGLSSPPLSAVGSEGADASAGWLVSGGMDKCAKVWHIPAGASIAREPAYTLSPAYPVRRALWRSGAGRATELAMISAVELPAPASGGTLANGQPARGVLGASSAASVQDVVELWDVRRGAVAEWLLSADAAHGGLSDIAWAGDEGDFLWGAHTSGALTQLDARDGCARAPLASVPRTGPNNTTDNSRPPNLAASPTISSFFGSRRLSFFRKKKPSTSQLKQHQTTTPNVAQSASAALAQLNQASQAPATGAGPARPNDNGYAISQARSESPAATPPQTFRPAAQQGAPQQKPQSFPWTVRRLQLPPPEIFPKHAGVVATTQPSPSPFPRYGHTMPTVAGSQGELYIFGGLVKNDLSNDLYQYNTHEFSAKLVQTGGERPVERVGHASAIVSSVLVVWGGTTKKDDQGNLGDNLDDGLYLLNLVSREWTRINVYGDGPMGRYGHAVTMVGARFFVFGGGVVGAFLNDLWCFDLKSLRTRAQWEQFEAGVDKPAPRTGHAMVTCGERILLFGGTDGNYHYNDTWMFDIAARRWTELECIGYLPAPRESHAVALVDDVMYVFGGRGINGQDLGELAAFKLSNQRWYKFTGMGPDPSPRSGHAMAAYGNRVIVLGGLAYSGTSDDPSLVHVLDTEYIKYPDSNPRAPNGSVIRKSTSGLTSRQRSLRQMHTGTPTSVASPPQGSVLNGRPLSPELGEISSEPGQRAASPVPTAALGSTRSNIHPTNPEVVPHQSDNTETAVPTTLEDVLEGYPHLVADNHCLLLGQADDIDVHLVAWIHHAFVVVMQAKLLGTALDEHRMAIVLDVIQAWLDVSDPDDPRRRPAVYRLIKLAADSEQLPRSLDIYDVDLGGVRDYVRVGGMADIYRGTYRGRPVAVKKLRLLSDQRSRLHKDLAREALVWRQLKHPHVLEFVGIDKSSFGDTHFTCLVSPWMSRGTLKDYINSKDYDPDHDILRLLIESAEGLSYLHSQKVVHGDVKDVNILIDDERRVQLADFGLVTVGDGTNGRMTTTANGHGSGTWMSPERIEKTNHRRNTADDVYAFACLGYYMFVHSPPFYELDGMAPMLQIISARRPARPAFSACHGQVLPDALWDLICACWSHAPEDRPEIAIALDRLRALSNNVQFQPALVGMPKEYHERK